MKPSKGSDHFSLLSPSDETAPTDLALVLYFRSLIPSCHLFIHIPVYPHHFKYVTQNPVISPQMQVFSSTLQRDERCGFHHPAPQSFPLSEWTPELEALVSVRLCQEKYPTRSGSLGDTLANIHFCIHHAILETELHFVSLLIVEAGW